MLDGQETLTVLPGSDQRTVWVPQRRSIKHTVFNIPEQLTGRKRRSALQLKIDAWSPFKSTAYAVAWSKNSASVYAWDSETLTEHIKELGHDPSACDVLPETFIRQPHTHGLRLVKCVDGFEAQTWTEGFLESTRWWANEPPPHEWSLFSRTAGILSSSNAPVAQDPDWLLFPWNGEAVGNNIRLQFLKNDRFIAAGCAILLAPCVYFTAEWATFSVMTARTATTIETIEEETRSVREDRSRALSALETAEDLVSLDPFPRQIEIVSRAHHLLSPHTVTLANWDYDEGILEFGVLSDTDIDSRVFITAFENDPMFSDVGASTVGQRLVLRMNVYKPSGLEE